MSDSEIVCSDEFDADVLTALLDDSAIGPEVGRNMMLEAMAEAEGRLDLSHPFDRSVALVFELVNTHDIDPWSIELRSFAELFSERIADASGLDLPACGRLIRMAWSVLNGRATRLLERQQALDTLEDELFEGMDWDDWTLEYDDASYEFTSNMVNGERLDEVEAMMSPKIRGGGGRPVTLGELIEGLRVAHEEADIRVRLELTREERRQAVDEALGHVSSKVHNEDLETDLKRSWSSMVHLCERAGEDQMSLGNLMDAIAEHEDVTSDDDRKEVEAAALISVLFMARRGLLGVEQTEPTWDGVTLTCKAPLVEDFAMAQASVKSGRGVNHGS